MYRGIIQHGNTPFGSIYPCRLRCPIDIRPTCLCVFKSGNASSYRKSRYDLDEAIRNTKSRFCSKLEDVSNVHFQMNSLLSMLASIQRGSICLLGPPIVYDGILISVAGQHQKILNEGELMI